MLEPRDAQDLRQIVADAASQGRKLELRGGGTRAGFGAPREVEVVSLRQIAGVVDYDPAELVLTVRPGTPLADVQALVAGQGQMLAFEPWGDADATIGGTVAASVAGSRRVTAGSARDHLLGLTAISGRGESFVAGAKVVKNVTGYDLPKLMAGSWGRLGAMIELTLKVLPRPRVTATMLATGLPPRAAHAAMACALGSNAEVSAAAHLSTGETLLRVAGFAPSVEARCMALPALMAGHCPLQRLTEEEAAPLWQRAMTGAELQGSVRWKVHLPPARAPELLERLAPLGAGWAMDWGGGLVWVTLDDPGTQVRDAAAALGGEATLIAAPQDMRATVPALQPRAAGVMALEQRVRRAFDPAGVFATGRFMEDADADQLSA
ncbi:FAD-binding protein [Novosphingobium cyanobacteriorum]|uniref:FAD-binding protein n=1 Tax=Novosphingobium cyanobacteriorum TaxID=3024215 RepID=A0ABT6CL09_9SPHN|nr:FAD-binding protein [Novosphingobium cyanobacteriorum]MDF8334611.1 FAD-binding protein [Novosphingobium cyanobacteriorum]